MRARDQGIGVCAFGRVGRRDPAFREPVRSRGDAPNQRVLSSAPGGIATPAPLRLVGDVSKADDLVQDSAERAIKNQAMLESLEKLYPWLRSILHNLHIDGIRQRSRWGPMDDVDAFTDSLALSVPAADGAIAVDLGRAMAELSVEHRAILLLSGLEGLSYREIGETLGIPIGTVMSRLARAREQLRRRLEGERV